MLITEQDARDYLMRVLDSSGEPVTMEQVVQVTAAVRKAHGTWDFASIDHDAFWQCVQDELTAIDALEKVSAAQVLDSILRECDKPQ